MNPSKAFALSLLIFFTIVITGITLVQENLSSKQTHVSGEPIFTINHP